MNLFIEFTIKGFPIANSLLFFNDIYGHCLIHESSECMINSHYLEKIVQL